MNIAIDFLKRFPLLGLALCAALIWFGTGPKVIEEAKIHQYLGGAKIIKAQALSKYTQEYRRRGRKGTDCFAEVLVEGVNEKVRIECSEWDKLGVNTYTVDVFRGSQGLQSASFVGSHFGIDLFILFVEIAGILYFLRLFLKKDEIPVPQQVQF